MTPVCSSIEQRNSFTVSRTVDFMSKAKTVLKGFGILLLILAGILLLLLVYLTVREYRPKAEESLEGNYKDGAFISLRSPFSVMSYNTGYAGLSKDEDFFMDGGTKVKPASKALVEENMEGITKVLQDNPADAYFLQEVDIDSTRSYHIDERSAYSKALEKNSFFAYNFKCDYVPYPLPPIGHVESGLVTLTDNYVAGASRISLPESFSWPIKTCNLKRCLLVTRFPLQDSEKELVLINFHLEAYDSGEGKIAQSKMLADILEAEYEKGNYVIAGGDFNQTFEGVDKYPVTNKEDWAPGVIGTDDLPDHFSFAIDDTYPTCRLLNAPYTGSYDTSQVYVIDGFIVSDNLAVRNVNVIDVGFEHTDHQPVRLEVAFK